MNPPLHHVCCANVPTAALPLLATVRHLECVRVLVHDERAWVWWEDGEEQIVRHVLAMPGVELYERRDGVWYPHGSALPAFHVPDGHDAEALYQALTPSPVEPRGVPSEPLGRVTLRLVRDATPRTTTAMLVEAAALAAWVGTVPRARIESLSAARRGTRVLLRGRNLPGLPGGRRYWGHRFLAPLGLRPEPALPERALREALGVAEQELALYTERGVEIILLDAFEPLTRAGVRLSLQQPD